MEANNLNHLIGQFRMDIMHALREYSTKLMESYKTKIIQNIQAPEHFVSEIKPLADEISPDVFVAGLTLLDYWKAIENGRKPGGKYPPVSAVLAWVQAKQIMPQPYILKKTGKQIIPKQRQLAFLISRKIALKGTPPRPYLQQSVDELQTIVDTVVMDVVTNFMTNLEQELQKPQTPQTS